METASVVIQLQPADLKRFERFVGMGLQVNWRVLILFAVAILLIGGGFLLRDGLHESRAASEQFEYNAPRSARPADIIVSGLPIVLFLGIFAFFYRQARSASAYEKVAPGIFLPTTYEVRESGLFCGSERAETVAFWHSVARFSETDEDFYVMLGAKNGHVLPKRCFPTSEAAAIFANQIRVHLEKHARAALASA
jgi:hypothetical protein